jgi:F0F1-type ATP synthase alpha subunit
MKKGLIPAISVGIAVVLIGSFVYAADRRKSSKAVNFLDDTIREEEKLQAELLKTDEDED